jgi:hypothetical protein
MLLDLPFYKNDKNGNQCLQISMKIALEHFLGKKYTLEELDKFTGRKDDFWTWTVQIVSVLHELGLHVKFYSSEPIKPLLGGENYIKQHFGKHAQKILEKTDIQTIVKVVKNLIESNLFEKKKLDFKEVEMLVKMGCIILLLIDYNVLEGIVGFTKDIV